MGETTSFGVTEICVLGHESLEYVSERIHQMKMGIQNEGFREDENEMMSMQISHTTQNFIQQTLSIYYL